mmetsp:Transcript_73587/g.163554  ORF Transcript_73587/g.163554 Transcript_73587/m.163554 type:complete len:453 (-) Transcript_73587:62-1420(-)
MMALPASSLVTRDLCSGLRIYIYSDEEIGYAGWQSCADYKFHSNIRESQYTLPCRFLHKLRDFAPGCLTTDRMDADYFLLPGNPRIACGTVLRIRPCNMEPLVRRLRRLLGTGGRNFTTVLNGPRRRASDRLRNLVNRHMIVSARPFRDDLWDFWDGFHKVGQGGRAPLGQGMPADVRFLLVNMVKLTVELFMGSFRFKQMKNTALINRTLGVPFPTIVDEVLFGPSEAWPEGVLPRERPFLAAWMGNTFKPRYRRLVSDACAANAALCQLGARSRVAAQRQLDPIAFWKNATFAFVPGGDNPTRHGLFHVLAAGAIPVIFEDLTLDRTYPAFFPPAQLDDLRVFFRHNGNMDKRLTLRSRRRIGFNFSTIMPRLLAIPPERVRRMQDAIGRLRSRLFWRPQNNTADAMDVLFHQLRLYKESGHQVFRDGRADHWVRYPSLECVDSEKCRLS